MFDTNDRDELIDVLDSFQIAMFAVDLTKDGDGILLGRNKAFVRLHDVTPEDDVGRLISEIHNPEDAAFANGANHQCAATRSPMRVTKTMTYDSGKVRHLTSLIPIFDKDGQVSRVIGNVIGRRVKGGDHQLPSALGEMTRLSVETFVPLYKALSATELRAAMGSGISLKEKLFLNAFNRLCRGALTASKQLHTELCNSTRNSAQEYLLSDGHVARAIRDVSGAIES